MSINEFTPLQQLLFLYNLRNLALSSTLNVNNHTLDSIIKNNVPAPRIDILKKISAYLNVSIDLVVNNSLDYSIKIENKSLKKPIYIGFYEYIILRSRLMIRDVVSNNAIKHEIKNDSLDIFKNNFDLSKKIFEENENVELVNPIHLILFIPNNKAYMFKTKYNEYLEYLCKVIDKVYSSSFAKKQKNILKNNIFSKPLEESLGSPDPEKIKKYIQRMEEKKGDGIK